MVRPGHIARSTGGMQFQGKAAAPLSEREQHVLRERLMERATKEIPDNGLGGPLFRVVLCFAIAISFGAGVWRAAEEQVAYEFFAAWLLEIALSAENLFAIFMIFRYFKVPLQFQETVLWWGLLGAVVMRGGMIIAGGVAILLLKELMLAYAAVIIYSGFRLIGAPPIGSGMSDEEMSNNTIIKLVQYVIPVTDYYDGQKFLSTKPDGSIAATPLLVVLLAVELTDFIFAIDNVPALFGVAERGDVFIVFSATVFGLLGLRSAYTVIIRALPHMPYLQKGTGLVLVFVGVRALFDYVGVPLPTGVSLIGIIVVLSGSAAVSLWSADWGVPGPQASTPQPPSGYADPECAQDSHDYSNTYSLPAPGGGGMYGGQPGGMYQDQSQSLVPASRALTISQGAPGIGRTVAADLIGSALGDPPPGSSTAVALSFKMTAQD